MWVEVPRFKGCLIHGMRRGGGGNGRLGRRRKAAETGGGGSPLLWCRRRKKGSGGLSGAKSPNRPVGWLGRLGQNPKRISFPNKNWIIKYTVTPGFKAKTRCSSYVCSGSSCHTYGQHVNTENQCLYYINIITRDIVFTHKTISTLSSSSSGIHQSHRPSTGGNTNF
jgi:hypothetical protein